MLTIWFTHQTNTFPLSNVLYLLQNHGTERSTFSLHGIETRNLECLGWEATRYCTPEGPRNDQLDQNCTTLIEKGASGYCKVRDRTSGKVFHVMKTYCNTLREHASFRCHDALDFVHFRIKAQKEAQLAVLPNKPPNLRAFREGIVIVVYPKLVASTYATIRVLWTQMNCTLPIELWYRRDEMIPTTLFKPFKLLAKTTQRLLRFQAIHDPQAFRFGAKIHAICHSSFDRLLFLDADNVPVRDPRYLFESMEFQTTGAIFWPDFWHPDHSIFNVQRTSLLWELLDMPFVDMFEQESGQLVIDRLRHAQALQLVQFYAQSQPNYFTTMRLVYGDKDLFRLAWIQLNRPFTMIQTPPGMAGIFTSSFFNTTFCGLTMVQHDMHQNVLFLHRNQQKLTGKRLPHTNTSADPIIWTHILRIRDGLPRSKFVVELFRRDLSFRAQQSCFGRRDVSYNPDFYVQNIRTFPFATLESQLRQFALEWTQLYENSSMDSLEK